MYFIKMGSGYISDETAHYNVVNKLNNRFWNAQLYWVKVDYNSSKHLVISEHLVNYMANLPGCEHFQEGFSLHDFEEACSNYRIELRKYHGEEKKDERMTDHINAVISQYLANKGRAQPPVTTTTTSDTSQPDLHHFLTVDYDDVAAAEVQDVINEIEETVKDKEKELHTVEETTTTTDSAPHSDFYTTQPEAYLSLTEQDLSSVDPAELDLLYQQFFTEGEPKTQSVAGTEEPPFIFGMVSENQSNEPSYSTGTSEFILHTLASQDAESQSPPPNYLELGSEVTQPSFDTLTADEIIYPQFQNTGPFTGTSLGFLQQNNDLLLQNLMEINMAKNASAETLTLTRIPGTDIYFFKIPNENKAPEVKQIFANFLSRKNKFLVWDQNRKIMKIDAKHLPTFEMSDEIILKRNTNKEKMGSMVKRFKV